MVESCGSASAASGHEPSVGVASQSSSKRPFRPLSKTLPEWSRGSYSKGKSSTIITRARPGPALYPP
jgi:hypothetical protein